MQHLIYKKYKYIISIQWCMHTNLRFSFFNNNNNMHTQRFVMYPGLTLRVFSLFLIYSLFYFYSNEILIFNLVFFFFFGFLT